MSKKLAVFVIHGMGSQSPGFADEMIDELSDRILKSGNNPDEIAWKPVFWADILEAKQRNYLRAAKRMGDMDFITLRKFMITAFGDASAYQKVPSTANTTYEKIHDRVASAISSTYTNDLGSSPKPMIFLTHSLGGHIMSNYVWDTVKTNDSQLSKFERMGYLAGIVTFGCNIPFFTFAYDKVVPIKFPPTNLPQPLKSKAKWFNYYDPDDVLGYPLQPINADYKKVVSKDVPINVGGILSSWNPMSHAKYWTDNDFTKPVSKFLSGFL